MKTHQTLLVLSTLATSIALACPATADPPPAPPPPPTTIVSPGLLAGGIVVSLAGGTAMTLGAVRIVASETCPDACSNPEGNKTIGAVILTAGAVVLAGGIVMAVLGSRKAPAAATSSVPVWVGAPGGAGWQWRF
ncbi:Hypothetical protein A7982_06248 [Minicystis rosea]|nr:Hypothetical protein A7982_06248 [Minicystis rosea]